MLVHVPFFIKLNSRTYILIRVLLASIRLIVLEVLSIDLLVVLVLFVVDFLFGLLCLAFLGFGSCFGTGFVSHDVHAISRVLMRSRRARIAVVLTRCRIFLLYNLLLLSIIVIVIASASSSGFVALGNVPVKVERDAR